LLLGETLNLYFIRDDAPFMEWSVKTTSRIVVSSEPCWVHYRDSVESSVNRIWTCLVLANYVMAGIPAT